MLPPHRTFSPRKGCYLALEWVGYLALGFIPGSLPVKPIHFGL